MGLRRRGDGHQLEVQEDPGCGHHGIRGASQGHDAPLHADHIRGGQGSVHEIPRRTDLQALRRPATQAGSASRQGGRPIDHGNHRHDGSGSPGVLQDSDAGRKQEAHRRGAQEGDLQPAGIPRERGPGLPVPGPERAHPVRGGGPAHPSRLPGGLRVDRGAVRSGRTLHRAAPEGQHPAPRHALSPSRHRQHGDRHRARPGNHRNGGLGPGPRARSRSPGRAGRRCGDPEADPSEQGLPDGPLPRREGENRDTGGTKDPERRRGTSGSRSPGPRKTT